MFFLRGNGIVAPQLLILAGGMGRRFGGLKQLEPVGPRGGALMDYTVFDALRSGFDRVVLVIRRETEEAIRSHVESGFGRKIGVDFVFQKIDASRSKPWGTAQAVLVASDALDGPFAVVNADDYYGAPAIEVMGRFLTTGKEPGWAMMGYRLTDTLPVEGAVSRAIVHAEDGWMRSIKELDGLSRGSEFDPGTSVSMNLWGLDQEFLDELDRGWAAFLRRKPTAEDEYALPEAVGEIVGAAAHRVRVLTAQSRWCGMTSPADRAEVSRALAEFVEQGLYPERLWG